MKTIISLGKKHTLYSICGRATVISKEFVSLVYDNKIKSYTQINKAGSLPVALRNNPRGYNRLFITDIKGRQHALQLKGFDILCNEGDELTAIWAIGEKAQRGPYVAFKNNSTGQAFFNNRQLNELYRPGELFLAIPALGSAVIGSCVSGAVISVISGFAGCAISWILREYYCRKKTSHFKETFDFIV